MKFFIDTANLDQICEAAALGVLDGVTTNPSLMAKEGITGKNNILKHYVDICNIVDGDVSAEVNATDYDGMIREGEELADLHPQIVVKLPMTKEGVKACKYFTDKGIKTNVTLVFSAGQAILAAKAGATYVSPFIGRLDDVSTDGLHLIEEIREIYDNYGFETQILGTQKLIDLYSLFASLSHWKIDRYLQLQRFSKGFKTVYSEAEFDALEEMYVEEHGKNDELILVRDEIRSASAIAEPFDELPF